MKFIVFLCLFLCCPFFALHVDVSAVSKGDTKDIKALFEYLIQHHDFGYTIFGSKPMSLADINLELPKDLSLYKRLKFGFVLKKTKRWLNAWSTNKDKVDLQDFIFLDAERDWIDCLIVVLINKRNMLKTLHEHEMIFKQELGASFTPESFLEKIEKGEVSLANAINKSQYLLGIMLGYGERNASLFQERFNLQKAIVNRKKSSLDEDPLLTQQLAALESQAGDFSELEEDAIIPPLYFLADLSHPETIELKCRYEADRKLIELLKMQPHFMDRVWERLTKSTSFHVK